jgi:hypothetical protein
MKYKILIVSLLSTLAMAFGEATACDRERPNGNPHRMATEKEIAEHEEETRRIAEQDTPTVQNIIELMFINIQVGGVETVDLAQQFQTLTEGFTIQATSLKNSVNNLTTMLAEISGEDLKEKIINLVQIAEKEKKDRQDLMQTLNGLQNEQAETNRLLKALGQHQDPSPLSSTSHEIQPLSSPPTPSSHSPRTSIELSSYQQGLLTRKDQIGEEAWKLLGGENASLAAALFNSIQQNSGTVEILSLENNSF